MNLTNAQIDQVERLEECLQKALAEFLYHESVSSHVLEVVLSRWPARLLASHLIKTPHSPETFDRLVESYATNHAQQLRIAYGLTRLTNAQT